MTFVVSALKVISQRQRERILRLVWDRELTAGDIAARFEVTFGAVSQHLKVLADAGLVAPRRDGRRRWYRARKEALGPLAAALEAMWADRLGQLKALAEAEVQVKRRVQKRRNAKRQMR
jgi:DNA-binding transcriptional ArsR family regulator